ncbi:hypothetical protein [Ruminiclostridium cellobioparum]|uniref:Uncharacterized protein n=1 Tax=Ruminiclostridium cellobioparum subsp. termitidis CT1112 TaxID=1195236 RepID=S0FID3_RUMCE|nr:hypothetical protein [Ruminiclostridium cellobioparum]EMS71392.1 hypothetical protein CTER_2694 [Ruminiclostridium cellobioparum subsp. termitidis CT1112]
MSEYVDNFSTEIPIESLKILLRLGREFYFDPLSSIESEEYFIKLLKKCEGDNLESWLRSAVSKNFLFLESRPEWIQGSEWQFSEGKPMMFVGQINLSPQKTGLHDDAVFYVFWDRESGETKTILQIA